MSFLFMLFIEYFSQHLGEYEYVLAALEDLNISILKAMDKTKKVSNPDFHQYDLLKVLTAQISAPLCALLS